MHAIQFYPQGQSYVVIRVTPYFQLWPTEDGMVYRSGTEDHLAVTSLLGTLETSSTALLQITNPPSLEI